MSTDAIAILTDDHRQIRRLFGDFRAVGDNAPSTKGELASRIIEELTVHTFLENEVMYPEVRSLMPELEREVLRSCEVHHVADVLCVELDGMQPDDEGFDAKMTVLMESVSHHMDEEERWFPKVRKTLGSTKLHEIGARIVELGGGPPQALMRPRGR